MITEGAWADDKPTPTNQDRLVFLFCHFVGHIVQVKLRDGVIYEGLLHSISTEDFSVILQYARPKLSKVNGPKVKTKPKNMLHIPGHELASLFALEVSLGGERTFQEGFFTDGDITGRHFQGGIERELQHCDFLTQGSSLACLDAEIASYKNNTAWDQFGENERRFGYRTTFDENLYTTRLDQKQFTVKEIREAERIAKEIEQGISDDRIRNNVQYRIERNMVMEQDYDEEELHSSVYRPEPRPTPTLQDLSSGAPGKYVPPHKRSQQPTTSTKSPKTADPAEFMSQSVEPTKPIPASAMSSADVEKQLLEPTSAPNRSPLPLYPDTGTLCWADQLEEEEEEEGEFTYAYSMPVNVPSPPHPSQIHPSLQQPGPSAAPPPAMAPVPSPGPAQLPKSREDPSKKAPAPQLPPRSPEKPPRPLGSNSEVVRPGHLSIDPNHGSPKQRYAQFDLNKVKKDEAQSKKPTNREQEISLLKAWSVHLQEKLKKHQGGTISSGHSESGENEDADGPSTPGSQSSKSSSLNPNAKEWKPPVFPNAAPKKTPAAPAATPVIQTTPMVQPPPPPAAAPAAPAAAPAEEPSGDSLQASEWRPSLKVPRDQYVMANVSSSLVARLINNEGFANAIGGDRQYSHLWVKAPADLKDFVYYIDLESVQDETEALHHPHYAEHSEMHMGSMVGPDGRSYPGGYMGQPGYMVQGGQIPGQHVPSSPGTSMGGPPGPYPPGNYPGYHGGYGGPMGSYGGAGMAPAAAGAGGPGPRRMAPPVGPPPHMTHMVDMGQGVHPHAGHRGSMGGAYYPPTSSASPVSPASSGQTWQQPQGMGGYGGYRDHHSSGGPGGGPGLHQHSHSPHAHHHHPNMGQMQHLHMQQGHVHQAGAAGQPKLLVPSQAKKQDPGMSPAGRDMEEQGKGRSPSAGTGGIPPQRPQRYAPPTSHRPPDTPPSGGADDSAKRGPAGSKVLKGRGRKDM